MSKVRKRYEKIVKTHVRENLRQSPCTPTIRLYINNTSRLEPSQIYRYTRLGIAGDAIFRQVFLETSSRKNFLTTCRLYTRYYVYIHIIYNNNIYIIFGFPVLFSSRSLCNDDALGTRRKVVKPVAGPLSFPRKNSAGGPFFHPLCFFDF